MKKITCLLILSFSSFSWVYAAPLPEPPVSGDHQPALTEAKASFTASPSQFSGKTPELVISASSRGGNVAAFQNTSPDDVSGITFRDNSNLERSAIGVGNPGSGFYANLAFIEIANKTGSPDDFAIVNTTAGAAKRVVNVAGIGGTTTFSSLTGPNLAAKFLTDGQLRGTISLQDLDEASAPGLLVQDKDGQEKMALGYANTGFSDLNLAGKSYVQFPGEFVFRNTGGGNNYPLVVNGHGIVIPSEPPDSSTSGGLPGQIAWDANFLYVCTAKNEWKRSSLANWNGPVYTELNRTTLAHQRLTLLFLCLTTLGCIVSSIVSLLCLVKLNHQQKEMEESPSEVMPLEQPSFYEAGDHPRPNTVKVKAVRGQKKSVPV